jgi:hypothetical protein
MYPACPSCGRSFEPEPGYFVGAMYFSYFLAVPLYALLCLLALRLLGGRTMLLAFGAALVVFAPLAPLLFRVSRILWLYFDCWLERRIG